MKTDINLPLTLDDANLLMDAINMAIKAATNSIEFSLMINPLAVRLGQARAEAATSAPAAAAPPAPANRQQRRAAERKTKADA
jgi:hypothetical protein